jgi:hypothetical protein
MISAMEYNTDGLILSSVDLLVVLCTANSFITSDSVISSQQKELRQDSPK